MAGTVPIVIELDENAPIKSLAQLHRIPGLAKIHFNFDVFDKPRVARRELLGLPAPAPRANGSHQTSGKFSPSAGVLEVLTAHGGPMTRREIKAAGGENGERMVQNINSMVSAGKLKMVGPATYDLADRSGTPRIAKAMNGTSPTQKSAREVVLEALAKNGMMSKPDFKVPLDLAGRSYSSVGDTLRALIKDKQIKRLGRGRYAIA